MKKNQQVKTGRHYLNFRRSLRSIRIVCTCGWHVTGDKGAVFTPEMHRAVREHLNLRDAA